ncbi:MAG: ABC transporter permease [Bacteroidales bacterium]|nr:ABC transporter permease [Bacteroidales bacterium]
MARTPFHLFLSQRILKDKGNKFSRPIIRLSVCGIAIGLVIMILALGVTAGYKKAIRDRVIAMGSHIRISHFDQNYSFEQTPIDKKQAVVPLLQKHPDILGVQNYATKVGVVKTADQVEGIVLKGIDETFQPKLFQQNMKEGTLLQLSDTAISNQIILSTRMATKLQLKIGDKVQTYFVQDPPRARSFVVCGLYETGMTEYDERYAIVDLQQIQKLNDWDSSQISGMEVLIRDYDKIDEMGAYVHSHADYDLKAETIKQLYPDIFDWLALFDTNVAILLAITTCVCLITMISIFFIIILEQTQTIGILKSMGMRTGQVMQAFVYVAGRVLLRGMLIGNALGLLFGFLQQHFQLVKLNPDTYYVSAVPIHFQWWSILLLNVGVFVICMLVLLLPAWIVGRKITPVEAIRFE